MHLSVKGKQLDVGDSLRSHVAESLGAVVGKYFGKPIEANVVFSREAHLFKADISVHVGRGIMVQSFSETDDPYRSFDTACDKIAKRLSRYKSRLKDHHNNAEATAAQTVTAAKYILQAEPEGHQELLEVKGDGTAGHQPLVVAEMTTSIELLTVGEAVMRMELAELSALMFRNRAHGGLNMIYRRTDGNVGWVDPKGSAGPGA
ncbi:MAG: ribosome-associated translation inhibitor RaiA [Rhodospirillaceae bacterium]